MSGQPISHFVTYKEPVPLTREDLTGIIFRSHVVMSDGQNLIISDSQHGDGWARVNETLVFRCDSDGTITDWSEVGGGRELRTDEVVNELNESGYWSSTE